MQLKSVDVAYHVTKMPDNNNETYYYGLDLYSRGVNKELRTQT